MGSVINRIRSCLEKNYLNVLDLKLIMLKFAFIEICNIFILKILNGNTLKNNRFWQVFFTKSKCLKYEKKNFSEPTKKHIQLFL